MKRLLAVATFMMLFICSLPQATASVFPHYGSPYNNEATAQQAFTAPDLAIEILDYNGLWVVFTDKHEEEEDEHYNLYRVHEDGEVRYLSDYSGNNFGVEQVYEDYELIPGHFYTYYVDAVLPGGDTLHRVAQTTTQMPLETPWWDAGYPHDPMCGTRVSLAFETFTDRNDAEIHLFRSLVTDSGYERIAILGNVQNYIDEDLKPRATYYYKFYVARGSEQSDYSPVHEASTKSDYFHPEFSVSQNGSGVELRIDDRSYADEVYHLSRSSLNEFITLENNIVLSDSGSSYIFLDQTTAVNTTYYYHLNAKTSEYCEGWPWSEDIAIVEFTTQGTSCSGSGSLTRNIWENAPGTKVTDIPVDSPPTHSDEITIFETPNYSGNNYASQVMGYICAPSSGYYTFWIASDDQSVLYLSVDQLPENKNEIARVNGHTRVREWDKYSSQQSDSIYLTAGQQYYIEVLHKEGNGADHLAVGWQMPDGTMERPIQGNRLSRMGTVLNQPPAVSITSPPDNHEENIINGRHVTADAFDPDGEIVKVQFYFDNILYSEDFEAPYAYYWSYSLEKTYEIKVIAVDDDNATAEDIHTYTYVRPDCENAGFLEWEIWSGITGTDISSVPFNTQPDSRSTLVNFQTSQYAGNNYGSRIRGYLCVPATGDYTFWISSDDKSELWLSTHASPAGKILIASVNGHTPFGKYDKYPSQQSAAIYLVKGEKYYIEARHKEGNGNDHLSVGWQLPDGTLERPIPGKRMILYEAPPDNECAGTGELTWNLWYNITGTDIASIPVNSTPDEMQNVNVFETPMYYDNNYGSRLNGYLCVQSSGNYTFWIASDDRSELWLSTDDNPDNKTKIASVTGYTASRQWTKYTTQQSAEIYLEAGHRYYVETLHKEANGNDHLAVGWQLPDGTLERPIPGNRLIPFDDDDLRTTAARLGTESVMPADPEIRNGFQMYPNPTTDRKVRLQITANISTPQQAVVQIVSATGKIIYDENIPYQQGGGNEEVLLTLDDNIASGIYMLRVSLDRRHYSKKLIVK